MKRKKTSYNFLFPSVITVALLCFILPDFNLLDIVPDFIGFFILYFALEKIAELDYRIEDARRFTLGFAALSLVKTFTSIMIGSFSNSSDLLLASTLFNVGGGILFFLLASNLFEGLNYTLMRNNASTSLIPLSEAKSITLFFGFSKIGLNFLPQVFSILEVDLEPTHNPQFFQTLEQIKNFTMLFSLTASLILGIYWFVIMRKFLTALKKDNVFIDSAFERYDTEVTQNTKYLARKKYLSAKYISLVAFFSLLVVQLSGKQIMPWFIAGPMFAISALILIRNFQIYTGKESSLPKSFFLYTALFTISEGFSFFYQNTQSLELYFKFSTSRMIIIASLAALSGILLTLISLQLLSLLRDSEEVLFDVDLGSRYIWQTLFLVLFIVLRIAILAAQPLRGALGFFNLLAFAIFVVIYTWYLRKEE